MRTQEEILRRLQDIDKVRNEKDFLGYRREVLIHALEDYEYAKPYLKAGVTREEFEQHHPVIDEVAERYYYYAIECMATHMAIMAAKVAEKLTEYAWLLGVDDTVAAMESAPFRMFGAPKVKIFAEAFDFDWPLSPQLNRMADGLPCSDDCALGCELQ